MDGVQVSKAKYLSRAFEMLKKVGSTGQLKRIANSQRYSNNSPPENTNTILTTDPLSSGNHLEMDMPVALILKCEDSSFVCVGEVNEIVVNGSSVDEISLDSLRQDSVTISYQMVFLIPTTSEDDPKSKHDWRGSMQ
jgi:hypothetical protein